jgi:1,2-diacylglycerol 3-alpha-glucosyltransferase
MNVCMMTNTYLPHIGGVARSVQTFTEAYRRKNNKVLVVAPEFPGAENGGTSDENVVRLPAIQRFNGSDFSVRLPLTALFNEQIDAFGANVVHSHHPFLLGDSALRIAATKHVPVVFTHHTLYEEYTHYVPLDSAALKQFVIELSTLYANLCDAVIAPSESISTLIQKRGVEAPIHVVPTGIDVSAFASGDGLAFRRASGIPPRSFVVGHVGRLSPEKNLGYLARAICVFMEQTPRSFFLIVGSGQSTEEIHHLFAERGLESRLRMVGPKTGTELCRAYAAMDVFAFSSLSETQGLVVAEAMAAGRPVVALDASGVREVVRNGENGFLLKTEAGPAEFAECLLRIRSQPNLRKSFSRAASLTAAEFDCDQCADRALALYESVRANTRRRREEERKDIWASLLKRIELEWDLLAEKTKAAMRALSAELQDEGMARDLST